MSHRKRKHALNCPRAIAGVDELNFAGGDSVPCVCGVLAARRAAREREKAVRKLETENDGVVVAGHLHSCERCRAAIFKLLDECGFVVQD